MPHAWGGLNREFITLPSVISRITSALIALIVIIIPELVTIKPVALIVIIIPETLGLIA